MCGRFAQYELDMDIHDDVPSDIKIDINEHLNRRYNIAPASKVHLVRNSDGAMTVERYRWGLRPAWLKDIKRPQPSNARIETVQTNGLFRNAFKSRHCAIPINNYYEWMPPLEGSKTKRPYLLKQANSNHMWLAGLWEYWKGDDEEVHTFTIITRDAVGLAAEVHDRMPIILSGASIGDWLASTDADDSMAILLLPPPPLTVWPVAPKVNSSKNEGEELLTPIGDVESEAA